MLSCRILEVDQETTEHYAALRVDLKQLGQPIPGNDMWIVALARQHKMPVISRDGHFDGVPQVKRAGW
jgi:tRNA(fMet)-specific endonuclease VapC